MYNDEVLGCLDREGERQNDKYSDVVPSLKLQLTFPTIE